MNGQRLTIFLQSTNFNSTHSTYVMTCKRFLPNKYILADLLTYLLIDRGAPLQKCTVVQSAAWCPRIFRIFMQCLNCLYRGIWRLPGESATSITTPCTEAPLWYFRHCFNSAVVQICTCSPSYPTSELLGVQVPGSPSYPTSAPLVTRHIAPPSC